MSILDAVPVYTSTGDILQIQYAQKRADSGNTCISLKSKQGVVMLVEKPIENNLYLPESDTKILKVTNEIYQMASGIETDLKHLNNNLRKALLSMKHKHDEPISPEVVKKYVSSCDGTSCFLKASAIGKGSRMAKTELEKLDLDNMSISELVENGIRIMYKAFDSVKDKPFDIEIGLFSNEEEGFVSLKKDLFAEIIERFKDLSVDDDE